MIKNSIFIVFTLSLSLSQDKIGTSAANFLGISMGSRATALGGAFTSISADASSIFYNPASISKGESNTLSINDTDWFLDSRILFISGNYKINKNIAFGSFLINLDYGNEEITDFENQEGTGTYWSANDLAFGSALSFNLTNEFSIGTTIKYINQRIHNETANSVATDIGIFYLSELKKFSMGFSISNFGLNMILDGKDLYNRIDLDPEDGGNNETIVAKIKTESWPLPLFLRLGISKQIQVGENISLLSSSDFIIPSDDAEVVCSGIELKMRDLIILRFGYNSTLNDYEDEYLTFGFGVKTKLNKIPINIDYSFQNRNLLNQTSTLGLSFSF
tara:strand:- start:242 stop:1240 length:999 start_codon:yes stop_codon:yes gene_type:complete